jgi:phage FluMu protein Com
VSDAAQRWTTFLGKVRARLGEILAEADAGVTELVETEVIDPGPVAAAENEVKARLFALRDKISPAWKKLEDELDGPLEDLGRALESEILEAVEVFEQNTRKKVLARLEVLAAEEKKARKLSCTKCGAPLPEPAVQHRVENVTCPHCSALNTVRPGLATAMVHALRPRR